MNWQASLGRLGPRERRLLSALFGVLAFLVLLVVPIVTQRAVLVKRSENEQIRQVIEELVESQPALIKADAQRKVIVARYSRPAPALGAFLDNQARQNGIEIPENQERPILPHGKRFDERSQRLQMRKVDLASFAHFMEGVERSQFPIIFSRLDIRKRLSESDSYDVEVIASAYDRKEVAKTEGNAQGASSPAPRSSGGNKAEGNGP
jgi:general secretion pathway protein M